MIHGKERLRRKCSELRTKKSKFGGREKGKEQGTAVEIKNGKNMMHRGDCDEGPRWEKCRRIEAKNVETFNRAELRK